MENPIVPTPNENRQLSLPEEQERGAKHFARENPFVEGLMRAVGSGLGRLPFYTLAVFIGGVALVKLNIINFNFGTDKPPVVQFNPQINPQAKPPDIHVTVPNSELIVVRMGDNIYNPNKNQDAFIRWYRTVRRLSYGEVFSKPDFAIDSNKPECINCKIVEIK
jgi:hypothetical protein